MHSLILSLLRLWKRQWFQLAVILLTVSLCAYSAVSRNYVACAPLALLVSFIYFYCVGIALVTRKGIYDKAAYDRTDHPWRYWMLVAYCFAFGAIAAGFGLLCVMLQVIFAR